MEQTRNGFKVFSLVVALSMVLGLVISVPAAAQGTPPNTPAGRVSIPAERLQLNGVSVEEVNRFYQEKEGKIQVIVELNAQPAVQVFASERVRGINAATEAARVQISEIDRAQSDLLKSLESNSIGVDILYRTQRVLNSIAMVIDREDLPVLARQSGIKAIHPLIPKEIDHTTSVPLIGAPEVWVSGLGITGEGITVGVIDTGIDYLHTNFGGPGTGYLDNDVTLVGDAPNFPGDKVIAGYDFVGDNYDANGTFGSVIPAPDSDPLDCNGHGSHVAGSVGGFGVNADGSTYSGSYGPGMDFAGMRIGPGVAPNVNLVALKVFGCEGSTGVTDQAIEWSVDPNGDGDFSDHLDVINMSLGSRYGSLSDSSAVAADNAALAGVIVVTSAGNSYDSYYITGSPGAATRAISTASSADSSSILDGFEVLAPASLAGSHPSSHSVNFNWAASSDVTADLLYPASNTGGCSAFAPGTFTGKIALLDWTELAPGVSACGSGTRVANAFNAGAVGVLFIFPLPYLTITIGGTADIPATITVSTVGEAILDAIGNSETVSVRLSKDFLATQSLVFDPLTDTLSNFSSRGPRRGDSFLKPDLTAPGQTIFSTASGTGNQGVSFNGTSMASPHVAGVMALLRKAHPSWSVEELKALVMNTASHDLYSGLDMTGNKYGPGRIGVGRVDAAHANSSGVILYNASNPGAVSVSFGVVEVIGTAEAEKMVTVVNKYNAAAAFDVEFMETVTIPGVTFELLTLDDEPLTSIALDPLDNLTFKVKMSVDGSLLEKTSDATISATQAGLPRDFLSEAGGLILLQETTSGHELRLSVHSVVRPSSDMDAVTESIPVNTPSGVFNVELAGSDVDQTDYLSLVTAFELVGVSPNEIGPSIVDYADIQYVGVMSNPNAPVGVNAVEDGILYFAISTYADWDLPSSSVVEFDIYIDTDQNGSFENILYNTALTENNNPTDVFLTRLFGVAYQDYLNGVTPAALDTNQYNNNVVVMPVYMSDLGLSDADGAFDFFIASYARENETSDPVDVTDVFTYDAANPRLDTTGGVPGVPAWLDVDGGVITVAYDNSMLPGDTLGLLLFHHHNAANRVEVIPFNLDIFMPFVSVE